MQLKNVLTSASKPSAGALGLLFFAGKGDCEEWNGPQKRNRRFFVGVFQLQHRRPRNGGFGFASRFRLRFSDHGHIGRFSVVFMTATLALAGRGIFRKQRFFEERFRFAMFLSMLGFIRCVFANSFAMPLFGRVNPASAVDSCWFKSPPSSERILNERTEWPSIFDQHRKGARRTAYWKPLRLFIRLEGQFCYFAFDVCRFFFLSNRFG